MQDGKVAVQAVECYLAKGLPSAFIDWAIAQVELKRTVRPVALSEDNIRAGCPGNALRWLP